MVEAGRENAHGVDSMDFYICGRRRVGCGALGAVVHGEFLVKRVGEGFHGGFGRAVRGVTGDGEEGKGAGCEDYMAAVAIGVVWAAGEWVLGRWGFEPVVQGSMCHIGCRPVYCVHLAAEGFDRARGEEAWQAVPRAAEYNRRDNIVVPFCDGIEDCRARGWVAEVKRQMGKALLRLRGSGGFNLLDGCLKLPDILSDNHDVCAF